MKRKSIEKIIEGYTLLINGLIENILSLEKTKANRPLDRKNGIDREILNIIKYRMDKVEGYLHDAKGYLPTKDLESLIVKYQTVKNKFDL